VSDADLWNKYLVAALNAAKYEGALRGILGRLKRGQTITPDEQFIKTIEDILTPQEYNVKM
jgi:hypothetical protein